MNADKANAKLSRLFFSGGRSGIRTPDPFGVNEVL
jgi:hypothetical protein